MLNRIKKLCKSKNMVYRDLSNITGISISTLTKIMSGVIKDPSIVTVSKIAKALGVSIDYLVYGSDSLTQGETIDIIEKYTDLNYLGKVKANEYIDDLLENKKYKMNYSKAFKKYNEQTTEQNQDEE